MVLTSVASSPLGVILLVVMTFAPASIEIVIEKFPSAVGFPVTSSWLLETTRMLLGEVVPFMTIVLLSDITSSFGSSMWRVVSAFATEVGVGPPDFIIEAMSFDPLFVL